VKNPDRRSQRGVEKALRIASRLGASSSCFMPSRAGILELEPLTGHTVAEIRAEALQLRQARSRR
jgi:hypothetical protein